MKRIFLTLAILVSVSFTSFASTETNPQKKGDFPKELKLSKEQKDKIKEVNKDFDKKIEAVKKTRIVEEVQKERIAKLQEEKKEAINNVLTPEQQAQCTNKIPRDQKKGQDKRGDERGRRDFRRGEQREMFSDLNLTNEQKSQMKELRKKYADEGKTANENRRQEFENILTPEQKAQLNERREGFKESRKSRRGDMEKFNKLDDAGKTKYKELKEAYQKEKSAIERSRIAPAMQKQKLDALKEKYDTDMESLLGAK